MKQILNTKNQLKLWDYTDPTEYLRSYYAIRKQQDSGFSYAYWAQELGIKSRSFLRLVLVGKRSLTEDVGQQFVQALRFNQIEARYFTHMVGLSRATTLDHKEHHSRELSKLRQKFALKNHHIQEIQQADLFDFLSSYRIPRVQVLLTLEEVEKSEKNLARLLNMKESEVAQHLQTLQQLGLAEKNKQGQWQAREAQLIAPDSLGNIALQSFHRKSLEEAIEAITLPKESRRYQSLVLALTAEQLQELHEDFRDQLERSMVRFDSKQSAEKRIYQINLNIIPVTGSILREEFRVPVESTEQTKEDLT